MTERELCIQGKDAAKKSYSPYSGFSVGAALLCADGTVYMGCNIENSSYTPTVCAERVAVFKAVSEGKNEFISIAIAGGRDSTSESLCPPCGVCLQVLSEFCDANTFTVILAKGDSYEKYLLRELLPMSFTNKIMG